MPEVVDWMSHRCIDVSTILNLASKWYPQKLIGKPSSGSLAHRAMPDVEHSIETLKFLKNEIF
jgi:oligoribonuclease